MWCRDCHKEVDVKTAGMAGTTCPLCNRTLVASTRQTDDIRRAYEILERWQSSDLFERISTTAPLTTLKQQDRAPLLNIPLGKPTPVPRPAASVSSSPDTPVSGPEKSQPATGRAARIERTATSWESLAPPLSGLPRIAKPASPLSTPPAATSPSDQVLWELLVAPRPLLAAAAPELEAIPTAAVHVPPSLLSGVSERRPPEERVPASVSNAMLDKVMADVASTGHLELFYAPGFSQTEEDSGRYDRPRFSYENFLDASDEEAPTLSEEASRLQDISAEADSTIAEWTESDAVKSDAVKSNTAESGAVESDAAESDAVETLPFRKAADVKIAGDFATPLEILQSASPLLMSSASSRVESAMEPANSAYYVNDINPPTADTTKKNQRAALRRAPLHRRFQSECPVSESSAGSDTVTRKLRLDQTGANAEASQVKEPVTSLPSSTAPETKIVSNSPKPGRRFRVDSAESLDSVTGTDGRRARTRGLPKRRYIDEAHESQLRGPHFEVSTPKRTNLTSMTGQFLAYLGVLGLTVGTAMVIYGHFGGYSEYTPTGWLVTTVAQMLLFLGVINLVSGGIEQNNEDVSRRINTIGEQLLRMEQVTSNAMKGPKLPAHLYADDAEAQETTTRETVTVHRS